LRAKKEGGLSAARTAFSGWAGQTIWLLHISNAVARLKRKGLPTSVNLAKKKGLKKKKSRKKKSLCRVSMHLGPIVGEKDLGMISTGEYLAGKKRKKKSPMATNAQNSMNRNHRREKKGKVGVEGGGTT